MQPTTPPGWYADPQDGRLLRWYDGFQWTAHVSPRPGAVPEAGAHPDSVTHWLLPTGRSWQSILAGYLGLFSILLFPAPLAVAFGVWGLVAAKRDGTHGRGRSVFGIVAGTVGTVILLVIFVQS